MSAQRNLQRRTLTQVFIALLLIGGVLLITADNLIRNSIDNTQKELYQTRLQTILRSLAAANERLTRTLSPDTYRRDFQDAFIKNFYAIYYEGRKKSATQYPVIINQEGLGIAHPRLPHGTESRITMTNAFTPKQVAHIRAQGQGSLKYTFRGVRKWTVFIHFKPWKWLLFYSIPLSEKYAASNHIRLILTSIFSGALLLSGLFFWKVTKRLTRRIQQLDAVAMQISSGSLKITVPDLGIDELGRLANSLERMRCSILSHFAELNKKNDELLEEIQQRSKAENLVRTSLQEKEALLKEIHHRVKNNLQTISSLLRLQMSRIVEENAIAALTDSVHRVHSMALVHEQLYRSDNLAEIDMKELFDKLLSGINRGLNGDGIRIRNNSSKLLLKIDPAIPCALILNELVTNAIKHAFPDTPEGTATIDISLTRTGENSALLEVADNGCGIPEGTTLESSGTLGLNLVHLLTKQLGGRVETIVDNGTRFLIHFPLEKTV